jgi:hypothetical protein
MAVWPSLSMLIEAGRSFDELAAHPDTATLGAIRAAFERLSATMVAHAGTEGTISVTVSFYKDREPKIVDSRAPRSAHAALRAAQTRVPVNHAAAELGRLLGPILQAYPRYVNLDVVTALKAEEGPRWRGRLRFPPGAHTPRPDVISTFLVGEVGPFLATIAHLARAPLATQGGGLDFHVHLLGRTAGAVVSHHIDVKASSASRALAMAAMRLRASGSRPLQALSVHERSLPARPLPRWLGRALARWLATRRDPAMPEPESSPHA